MRVPIAIVSLVMLAAASPAFAQTVELTPMAGYRFGGGMEDYASGIHFDIANDWSFGGMVDVVLPDGWAVEFLYSHQGTEIRGSGAAIGGTRTADFNVDLWQLGLVQEKPLSPTVKGFGVGTLGLTHFGSEVASDDRFSLGFGGGVKVFPTPRVGVRLEGRGYVTFVSTDAFYASGGSTGVQVAFASDAMFQGEITAGLVVRLGR